jgi:hypothetical protein
MASSAAWHDLDSHRSGSTWEGFAVQPTEEDGTPIDMTSGDARFVVMNQSKAILAEWTTADGITYELEGTDMVLKVHGPLSVLTLAAGKHHYMLELTLPTGEVWPVMEGMFPIAEAVPTGVTP